MAGWHHWLDAHEFGWTPGVGDGQGGLECCNLWGCKESDMTEWLNCTERANILQQWVTRYWNCAWSCSMFYYKYNALYTYKYNVLLFIRINAMLFLYINTMFLWFHHKYTVCYRHKLNNMCLRTWGDLGNWDWHIHTTVCKIASLWEPAIKHRELSLVPCDDLEGQDRGLMVGRTKTEGIYVDK